MISRPRSANKLLNQSRVHPNSPPPVNGSLSAQYSSVHRLHMQTNLSQSSRQPLPDMDLVHSAKQGEIAAFEELVRRHTKRVFAVARHITRSREDAEEVSQKTFLRAFLRLRNFEEKAEFSTWLTRIAVNAALINVARCTRDKVVTCEEQEWEGDSLPQRVPDWRPNPEQLYSQSQLREILRQALEALPQTYSTVFILRDIQGFSVSETAAALELSIPTIKTYAFDALNVNSEQG